MAKYLPDLQPEKNFKLTPTSKPSLSPEVRRKFALTQELFSRSIGVWDELEKKILCSGRNIDEWIELLKKSGAVSSFAYAGYLEAMKKHIELSKQRKILEKPQQTFLNRIPASRLVRRI
ncbi:MAG: hypothetical protein ACH346_01765 [Chthoniobacterales bacterium]